MVRDTIEVSLKGGANTWRGQEDASYATDLGATVSWKELRNVYLSKDGAEIRRMPGSATGSQMFLGEHIWEWEGERLSISAVTAASPTQITLKDNHDGATGLYVYISGHATITAGYYVMTRVSDIAFTIPFDNSSGNTTTVGNVWIQRVKWVHTMTQVDGVPCVVAETGVYPNSGSAADERRSIGTWVGSKPPDVTVTDSSPNYDTPGVPNIASDNTGDTGVVIWPCPSMKAIGKNEKAVASANKARSPLVTEGRKIFAWDMSIYGRCQVDSLLNRLLIAVPGHGVMMEANIGARRYPFKSPGMIGAVVTGFSKATGFAGYIPSMRWTKSLGIPKGVIKETDTIGPSTTYWLPQDSFVYVAVGYLDLFTGEAGLPSETVKITGAVVPGTKKYNVTVTALRPRVLLPESVGLAIVLYMSMVDAATSAVLRPIAIIDPQDTRREDSFLAKKFSGEETFRVLATPDTFFENDIPVPPERYPIISQFPTGASWVRTVQSRMLKGGDISSEGELHEILATRNEQAVAPDSKTYAAFYNYAISDTTVGSAPKHNLRGARASGYAFPNSYAGHKLQQAHVVGNLSPGRVVREVNRDSDHIKGEKSDGHHLPSFLFAGRSTQATPGTSFLFLEPNRIQYSEQANPGIVPAVNNLFIDNLKGRRTVAGARIGNRCLVMTDRATYATGGAMSPRNVNTGIVSLEYGCVAPGSVVEFPGGTAWLSAEGPVVYGGGGVQWVGAPIREKWKDFKRDSVGMMGYAQAAYDQQRDLVIWTLREDRKQTDFVTQTSDGEKAKVPSDTLLIWSWRSNVWSVSYRDAGAEVLALASMEAILNRDSNDNPDDVQWSICAMHENDGATAGVYPITVWEDKWSDRAKVPDTVTATADKTPGSDNFVVGSSAIDATAIDAGDMAFIRSPTNELRCWGDVSTLTGTAVPLKFDGASLTDADWKTGDVMEGRVFHMRLQSNLMRMGRKHRNMLIGGVLLRHEVKRDHDPDSEGALAWARVQIETIDGTKYQMSQAYWGDPITTGISRHTASKLVNVGEFRVHIDLIGNSQISLRDISVEVVPG